MIYKFYKIDQLIKKIKLKMCGIFFYIGNAPITRNKKDLEKQFYKIKHRGPDSSRIRYYNSNVMAGFHRLAIVDPTNSGMQPFENDRYICICNGEIYNYRDLIQHYKLKVNTHSDCEVILPLFLKTKDLKSLCDRLDGEFAFVIYDTQDQIAYFGVDEIRARPLFLGMSENKGIYLASEQKALTSQCEIIIPVPSGYCGTLQMGEFNMDAYYNFNILPEPSIEEHIVLRQFLLQNVSDKLNPEREYGFLLSGGLDSSLICGIAAKLCAPTRIHTFTVGFNENASDIIAARKVAKHIDSIHTEFIFTYQDGIDILESVIYANESWDQTTTRSSIPMALMIKAIKKKHPEMAVIFSGEFSDELFMGYLDWQSAPNPKEARDHLIKRVKDVTYFDGLRADRTISFYGMELRLPFFSRKLLDFVLSLEPKLLTPSCNDNIEKYLLRKAFNGLNYIPNDILWRTKNAFSDSTSIIGEKSWKEALKDYAEKQITDSRFNSRNTLYHENTPETKEDMLYREIFESYGYKSTCIPYKWKFAWNGDRTDSSATELPGFKE